MVWSDYEEQSVFQLAAITSTTSTISTASFSTSVTDRKISTPEQPPEA
jgi:hypothetical protein